MAKTNGGIIGPSNVPNPFIAKGVWKLRDAFNYIKAGLWPSPLGYQVNNSLRFNAGSSDNLTRTEASGSRRKLTFSVWCKKSSNGSDALMIYNSASDENNQFYIEFEGSGDSNDIRIRQLASASVNTLLKTSATFRDVSAWYHVVVAVDSEQATASNRVRLYINGSEVTAFSTATYPSQNTDMQFNVSSSYTHHIGKRNNSSAFYAGYMAETYLIDGQQLTPSSFGQTDSATGIWTPIAYTGSFGTNGFYLKFANSAALGTDSSGNGNTFTANNLTSVDQSTDTCTNNFNTLNPLIPLGSNFSAPTEGNLSLSSSGTGNSGFFASTIIPSAGKWYFEVKATVVSSSDRTKISIANFESVTGTDSIENGNYKGISVSTGTAGRIAVTDGATTTEFDVAGYVPVANDIMIFAVDMDNSRVYIGKNGTWFTTAADSGGNPATATGFFSPVLGNGFAVGAGHGAGTSVSATNQFNFGSPMYAGGGYTDAGGFGNFSYQPPSGYFALCTRTLAIYG